jgi:isopentenyl-diphosphate delta-isomerase
MKQPDDTSNRKSEHMRIVLNESVNSSLSNGFEKYHFEHQALPEIDLTEVDLRTSFFNRELQSPLLISSMTGGSKDTVQINRVLAKVAQEAGIALGVGSQRAGLEDPEKMASFRVREVAPDILLFSNLGAVQLNYSYSVEHCQRAVEAIRADALILHLNPLQEALQPEGNTNFKGLLRKIEAICKKLPVPVIVKEVGWGISSKVAKELASAGVAAIDVAGAGGTSWSEVEKFRIKDEIRRKVAEGFKNWGIPTADSILEVREGAPSIKIIASGGLTNGIEVAKSIALGASLAGLAARFIKSASISEEETLNLVSEINLQLKICMFSAGIKDINFLKQAKLKRI